MGHSICHHGPKRHTGDQRNVLPASQLYLEKKKPKNLKLDQPIKLHSLYKAYLFIYLKMIFEKDSKWKRALGSESKAGRACQLDILTVRPRFVTIHSALPVMGRSAALHRGHRLKPVVPSQTDIRNPRLVGTWHSISAASSTAPFQNHISNQETEF